MSTPQSVYEGEETAPTQEAEPITELPNGELNLVQNKDSGNSDASDATTSTEQPSTIIEEDEEFDDGNVVSVEEDDEDITVSVDKDGVGEKLQDATQEAKDFATSDTGRKVGIALACLFGLAFLCCCVGCFMRCRPQSKEERESVYVKETVYVEESDERQATSSNSKEPEPSQWTDPAVHNNSSAEPDV